MRNSCGGVVESRLPSSTRPGFVRHASGVLVEVGTSEAVGVAGSVGDVVGEGSSGLEIDGVDGEHAANPPRSRSSAPIRFIDCRVIILWIIPMQQLWNEVQTASA